MTPHFTDHIIVALLVSVFPIVDFFLIRKRAAKIRAGQTELRMKLYRNIIGEEWLATVVIVVLWFALGRGAAELGLIPEFGMLAAVGYGVAAIYCVLMFLQMRSVVSDPANHAAFRKQIGWLSFLTPHTDKELRAFSWVSITAGICEEIVFRGFLIAYLTAQLDLPFWGAAILSSLGFGFVHVYQGPLGVLKTGFVGGTMALLYGLTGSLWAPIVVHALMDLFAGRMSHAAFSKGNPEGTTPEMAA